MYNPILKKSKKEKEINIYIKKNMISNIYCNILENMFISYTPIIHRKVFSPPEQNSVIFNTCICKSGDSWTARTLLKRLRSENLNINPQLTYVFRHPGTLCLLHK